MNRRDFLRVCAAAGLVTAISPAAKALIDDRLIITRRTRFCLAEKGWLAYVTARGNLGATYAQAFIPADAWECMTKRQQNVVWRNLEYMAVECYRAGRNGHVR